LLEGFFFFFVGRSGATGTFRPNFRIVILSAENVDELELVVDWLAVGFCPRVGIVERRMAPNAEG